MTSKAVVDRKKSTNIVVSAQEIHGESIGTKVEALLSPFLGEGEQMPDAVLLGELAVRMMTGASEAMVVADKAHELELSDDGEARGGRDVAQGALHSTLVGLRRIVEGSFGTGVLARVGLGGPTPNDAALLVRRAQAVGAALREGQLPAPMFEEVQFDADKWADRLGVEAAHLESVNQRVQSERREAESTMIGRDKALGLHDARFRQGANFLVGLFSLAAEHELASRIRPSAARPGRIEADPDTPAPPQG